MKSREDKKLISPEKVKVRPRSLRKFSENEALDSLHLISEPELSGLPEYWISLHTYSCLLLEKKGWDKSLIIREYLKNFNRFRLKKGLVPS